MSSATAGERFDIEGHDLGYPTRFRDGSSMMSLFAVPAAPVAELIGHTGFRPARLVPGRALVTLNCVHYTETDCGAYDEVALAVLVEDPTRAAGKGLQHVVRSAERWRDLLTGRIGAYSWCLGVSSTLSRDCGLRMWGFPKVLGELSFERGDGRARMDWHDGGELVLSFSAPSAGRRTPKPISPAVYSIHRGEPHVGRLTQRYREVGHHLRGGRLDLGDHPLALQLRDLGLERRPLVSVWNGHLDFEMGAPEPLGAVGAATALGAGERNYPA